MSKILTKRAAILEKYASLRAQHPALPEVLKDFQVCSMMTLLVVVRSKLPSAHFSIQADIVACALDASSGGHHLLGALPTGFGKSLPMMVLSLLLPPGITLKLTS